MNKRYRAGANFERRVRKYFERDGFFVIRSAGSRGLVDLAVFGPSGQAIFIQCKRRGKLSNHEWRELETLGKRYDVCVFIARTDYQGRIVFDYVYLKPDVKAEAEGNGDEEPLPGEVARLWA